MSKPDVESAIARNEREAQWRFMDKVLKHGTVWFCPWDKYGKHRREAEARKKAGLPCDEYGHAPDEDIHGLLGGMEQLEWMHSHRDWWVIGRWNEQRCARPIRLTDAGKRASKKRHLYDMEPVTGGLVEPGFAHIPDPPELYCDLLSRRLARRGLDVSPCVICWEWTVAQRKAVYEWLQKPAAQFALVKPSVLRRKRR